MKQRSYKATGINLKAMPMGESDRLVTVLTQEYGLVRAIAPGARKHKSRLAGRTGLFVVNDLLFTRGKSLDKLVQAETIKSFPGLSRNLAKLTSSQYLAEIVLAQALTGQPQEDLYALLVEHLTRLEAASEPNILPCLAQATFHMLALAGVAPDVFRCCLSRSRLQAQLGDPDWRVAFSVSSGGAIDLAEIERLERDRLGEIEHIEREWHENRVAANQSNYSAAESGGRYAVGSQSAIAQTSGSQTSDAQTSNSQPANSQPANAQHNRQWKTATRSKVAKEVSRNLGIVGYLSAAELALMQQLSKPELLMTTSTLPSVPQMAAQFSPQIVSKSGTIQQDQPNGQSQNQAQNQIESQSETSFRGPANQPITANATRSDRSPAARSAERLAIVSSATQASGPHLMWRHIEQFLRQYAQYQFDRPIKSAALIDTCFTS